MSPASTREEELFRLYGQNCSLENLVKISPIWPEQGAGRLLDQRDTNPKTVYEKGSKIFVIAFLKQ